MNEGYLNLYGGGPMRRGKYEGDLTRTGTNDNRYRECITYRLYSLVFSEHQLLHSISSRNNYSTTDSQP